MFKYNKIVVIGCSGAGKSVFSRKLAAVTGLPLYHLDLLYWNADCTHINKFDFINKQKEILKTDSWIIDGNFRRTLEYRIKEAELIFFDLPTEVCLKGVMIRGKRPDMPCNLPANDELLEFIKNYNKSTKPIVLALLKKYPNKMVITFHSHKDADDFILYLNNAMYSLNGVNNYD